MNWCPCSKMSGKNLPSLSLVARYNTCILYCCKLPHHCSKVITLHHAVAETRFCIPCLVLILIMYAYSAIRDKLTHTMVPHCKF